MARTNAGRIRCFNWIRSVTSPLVGRTPPVGNQPSCTAKSKMSISPNQKVGIEHPATERTVAT